MDRLALLDEMIPLDLERFQISAETGAGLDALRERAPDLPLVIAGWSFGADVALTVTDPRLAGWFLIAPPIRVVRIDAMAAAHDPRPKRLAVPEHDEFRPPDSARAVTADWVNTTIEVVAGADHFFAGRTAKVAELFLAFAGSLQASGYTLGPDLA
jgi:alpha/beta superfamily hydrolase